MKYRKQIENAIELAEQALTSLDKEVLDTEVDQVGKSGYISAAGVFDAIILSLKDILEKDDAQ